MTPLRLFLCLIAAVLCCGCVKVPGTDASEPVIDIGGKMDVQTWHLEMDTLYIPVHLDTALTSMRGQWFILDGKLCFGDQTVALVHTYDTSGHFEKTVLKRGQGRDEIRSLYAIWTDGTSTLLTLGTSWNFDVFNAAWHKTDSAAFRFDISDRSVLEMYLKPDAESYDSYELAYSNKGIYLHAGRYIVFPVTSEHPFFNGYQGWNVKKFFRYSHTLGILDIRTGKMQLAGHFPTVYQNCRLSNFMGMSFDGMDDTLYISYMADSLIYKMDLKTRLVTGAFGRAVNGLNQHYPVHRSFRKAEDAARNDRKQYGWYGGICCIPETGLIFRTCHPGGTHSGEVLQVYRHDTLVGTFRVPVSFRIFGQIDGTYYAAGAPDLENERFVLYKCKFTE